MNSNSYPNGLFVFIPFISPPTTGHDEDKDLSLFP